MYKRTANPVYNLLVVLIKDCFYNNPQQQYLIGRGALLPLAITKRRVKKETED